MSSQTDAIAIPDIAANLAAVRARIRAAAEGAGRGGPVSLVAVSKTHGEDRIRPALEAGHRVFGENRVQEAETKWPVLKADFADVRLHLIGPLQTNKARVAVRLADVIETIDRPKLARAVAAEMDRAGRRPDCFIEVNTGEEPQKHGVAPDQTDDFVRACRDEYQLPIIGLMCVPPLNEEPSLHFALLRKIAERNGLVHLSMGMSHDFEIAVAFGATQVRVGTAIFGRRKAR
jgi:hypothetical protein